jgi:hypothetical protein
VTRSIHPTTCPRGWRPLWPLSHRLPCHNPQPKRIGDRVVAGASACLPPQEPGHPLLFLLYPFPTNHRALGHPRWRSTIRFNNAVDLNLNSRPKEEGGRIGRPFNEAVWGDGLWHNQSRRRRPPSRCCGNREMAIRRKIEGGVRALWQRMVEKEAQCGATTMREDGGRRKGTGFG